MRYAKLQLFIQNAVDNAGIGYTESGYLKPIALSDSEGLRFAKLGAWLTLLAENIGTGGGGTASSNVDPTITTTAQLAAIPMVGASLPVVKVWVQASDLSAQIWQAQLGSDASDPTNGVIRADDWATSGVVWYRRGP